jgi:hypothetical protein
MFKGFVIAVLLLLGASQLDQYLTHGRYGVLLLVRERKNRA